MHVGAVVSKSAIRLAKQFHMVLALFTGTARIYHTTHTYQIADFKMRYVVPHFSDSANNFVTGHTRIDGVLPFITCRM